MAQGVNTRRKAHGTWRKGKTNSKEQPKDSSFRCNYQKDKESLNLNKMHNSQ
jgi:hypothetical protein